MYNEDIVVKLGERKKEGLGEGFLRGVVFRNMHCVDFISGVLWKR